MVLIAGTCTAVCKKRWTATRLTHEVVQRFLEWDSLHYTPNHAKQDSLVIHRHDEKTTLRTSPTCRKYQNGLVTLVHQPNASSFNYFFGFPLGAHLPGQLSPSSMKALLSFPTALPPTWLMAGLCMSCWLGPQAESRYVSSLGVIDFFHFIQVSRNDDTERIWLTTSKCTHFFTRSGEALFALHVRSVTARIQVCFYVWILRSLSVCTDVLLTQSQFMGQNRQQISWTIAISCEKGSFFAFKFSLASWRIGSWKSLKS